MRLRKLAVWTGAAIGALVLSTSAPVSATPLIAGLGKTLAKDKGGSSVILVKRVRKRNRGNVGKGAAAAAGAAAVIGILGAIADAQRRAVIERCLDNHSDVDTERGVWYDRRGREHPCR